MNALVAGEGRTLSDLFDLTGWAKGKQLATYNRRKLEIPSLLGKEKKKKKECLIRPFKDFLTFIQYKEGEKMPLCVGFMPLNLPESYSMYLMGTELLL